MIKDSYLYERSYEKKTNIVNTSKEWSKIMGESTLDALCEDYSEVASFLSNDEQYTYKKSLTENEYQEILAIYKKGKFIQKNSDTVEYKDKLFYTFYLPFLNLAQYYGELKYSFIIKTYFFKGISEEIYHSLSIIANRILINEIHLCKAELKGKTKDEQYDYYITHFLNDPSYITELFQFYPMLLRCILEKICLLLKFFYEFLNNFKKDLPYICTLMSLVSIEILHFKMVGDTHNGGRATLKVYLDNKKNIYYKPRNLKAAKIYYELANELFSACKLTSLDYQILDRKTYGWEREIVYKPCSSIDELKRFYIRMGIHIMLSYILDIQDLHYENLIAQGEYPIFIDIEVLCGNLRNYRKDMSSDEKAKWILDSSVLGNGIIPQDDSSNSLFCALSGKGNQKTDLKVIKIINAKTSDIKCEYVNAVTPDGLNAPTLNSQTLPWNQFLPEIYVGFTNAYQYVLKNKESFTSKIQTFNGRILMNHTQNYSKLLQLSYRPNFMTDGGARQLILSKSYPLHISIEQKLKKLIFESELHDLINGDIPYFLFTSDNKSIFLGNNIIIPDFFYVTPEDYIQLRLHNLSNEDLELQLKLLTNALEPKGTDELSSPFYKKSLQNNKSSIHATYKEIGLYIIKNVIENDSFSDVSWFVPSNFREHVSDMYFYEGISGLAVFFSALNKFETNKDFLLIEQKLVHKLINYTLNNQTQSCFTGIFCGEGSIIYTYLLLYKIKEDKKFIEYAKMHEKKLYKLLETDCRHDLLYGNSGAIIVYIQLFEVTNDNLYLTRAEEAAGFLLQGINYKPADKITGINVDIDNTEGIAHGGSGFALSFIRLYEKTLKIKYLMAAYNTIIKENKLFYKKPKNWSDANHKHLVKTRAYWCHGAGGIALVRKEMLKFLTGNEYDYIFSDYQIALGKLKEITTLSMGSFCLCHGILGNLVILQHLQKTNPHEGKKLKLKLYRFCSIINNIDFNILENANPGFMMGLSGIGYAILYMLYDGQLPNILIFKL